ncbi:DUF1513 domain-containing protein [Vibrio sp. SCSIO 43136]|uniref:DUF1513 domain-containing protein n=1 Tax=Vibrio sp. SCSIO 43136 TaxID=2819101 RepID=UPI0020764F05|nr:DUF1513 domain-containing protein [Vibrio sp. SCSIO 43136]USD66392.1 DUF1513 domain-containing protein [Vibrio sp. SCSIO 43136]
MVTDIARRRLLQSALLGTVFPYSALASDKASSQPALIGCAWTSRDRFKVVVADRYGQPIHLVPLPARGHGVAIAPQGSQAIAFARRPGDFFMPFDYQTGVSQPLVVAESNRHFYGHGVFSHDGKTLYATQGDKKTSRGIIGVYDVERNYQKVDEWTGFGIGPHEIIRLPNDHFAIGVGGVHTRGRTPLNLDEMEPSLSYLNPKGQLVEQVGLEDNKLSIRHLSFDNSGRVFCGQQYRGDPDDYPSLIAIHQRGGALQQLNAEPEQWARFNHYIASIASDDKWLVATSPRGGCYGIWDLETLDLVELSSLPDASGVVRFDDGFWLSSGAGRIVQTQTSKSQEASHEVSQKLSHKVFSSPIHWDNHWNAIKVTESS